MNGMHPPQIQAPPKKRTLSTGLIVVLVLVVLVLVVPMTMCGVCVVCGAIGSAAPYDPEQARQARIVEQRRQQAEAERLRQEQVALAARQQAEREAEQARFYAMSPSDHLSAASSALEAGNFSEVERHLEAIPSESDQADQIDRVRREVPRRRLALAREALDNGYDRSSRTGGDLATAESHLRAIGENDREAREAQRLRREIEERRARQQSSNASSPESPNQPAPLTAREIQICRDFDHELFEVSPDARSEVVESRVARRHRISRQQLVALWGRCSEYRAVNRRAPWE